ncbi:titin isoform X2 [Drosophila ficusphila]|uniref:titin isoform X2 n=1 Tax=Drosophila ficusphila TaxID=30025 RepID=UPI001C8AAA8A|nr:titin isoform X2 [Drosophila ficusphila]
MTRQGGKYASMGESMLLPLLVAVCEIASIDERLLSIHGDANSWLPALHSKRFLFPQKKKNHKAPEKQAKKPSRSNRKNSKATKKKKNKKQLGINQVKMVVDIKMCRFDNVPWGFRLVGGADYDYPLTVVKVTEGSIADEAGLRVEDIVVRINDTAATPLSHDEAHRLIMNSGSVFYFGVYRENEEDAYECLKKFPTSDGSLTISPSPTPSLSQLPEATNARSPEPESFIPPPLEFSASITAPVENVDMDVDVGSLAECRQVAVSEVQAEDNRGNCLPVEAEGHPIPSTATATATGIEGLYLPDLPDRPCSVLSERQEIKLVEEEIAAVLSGESEVLKEHNVLGIFPKPGVCMSSDVLRSLNEEVTKTKLEKDKENRQWSTFLQRPNRPVPKSKQALEAERRAANAYKVSIVKSAPREKSPMPEAKPAPKETTPPKEEKEEQSVVEDEPVAEQEPLPEAEKQEEEPLPTDSEVPNLEQLPENESPDEQPEKTDAPKDVGEGEVAPSETGSPGAPETSEPSSAEAAEATTTSPPGEVRTPPKTDEELALERQLADVQRQLAALSSLPSTIQSTLDAVTKQLAELLPTFKLQQQQEQQQDQQPEAPLQPQIDEKTGEGKEEEQLNGETNTAGQIADAGRDISISGAGADNPLGPCENNEDRCDANDREVAEISRSTDDNRLAKDKEKDKEKEQEPLSEEQSFKKQKRHDVIEELEEHLVRKNNPRRSKRAFGPLVPSSERPLVLPGGRRWYRPKDAYNDEFIAETLSAQAELITGSTLGVNFMKYQKPERKIDLNRSEVYKYLNPHLDRAPVRGIEVRAPLVAAESDIRQSLQS